MSCRECGKKTMHTCRRGNPDPLISQYYAYQGRGKQSYTNPNKVKLFKLLDDVFSRRGIKNIFDGVDNDIVEEILVKWLGLIAS